MYYDTNTLEEYAASILRTEESSPSGCLSVTMDHNIDVHKCALLPALLHNCESQSVTMEGEHRVSVWEQGVQNIRNKAEDVTWQPAWENCITKSYVRRRYIQLID